MKKRLTKKQKEYEAKVRELDWKIYDVNVRSNILKSLMGGRVISYKIDVENIIPPSAFKDRKVFLNSRGNVVKRTTVEIEEIE